MEHNVNKSKKIWSALSDLFIDNEIEYEFIARRVHLLASIDEVYYELFEVVAPVCYENLQSIIPSVWQGFDETSLFSDINNYQAELESSKWKRFKHKIIVKYCKKRFSTDWKKLKAEIVKKQTSPEIS